MSRLRCFLTPRAWILSSRAENESLGGGLSRTFFAAMRLGEDLGRSKQGRYTRGLPEIYRKFTGDTPEHHRRSTLPPRQPRWDAPTAEMWSAAASEARRCFPWQEQFPKASARATLSQRDRKS